MKRHILQKLSFFVFVFIFQVFSSIGYSNDREWAEDIVLLTSAFEGANFISSIAEPPSAYKGILPIKNISVKLALVASANFIPGKRNYKTDDFKSNLSNIETDLGRGFPPPWFPNFALMTGVNILNAFTFHIGGLGLVIHNTSFGDFGVSGKWTITETFFTNSPVNWAIRAYYGQLFADIKDNDFDLSAQSKTIGFHTSVSYVLIGFEPYLGTGVQIHDSKVKELKSSLIEPIEDKFLDPPSNFHLNTLLGINAGSFTFEYKKLFNGKKFTSSKLTFSLSIVF